MPSKRAIVVGSQLIRSIRSISTGTGGPAAASKPGNAVTRRSTASRSLPVANVPTRYRFDDAFESKMRRRPAPVNAAPSASGCGSPS